MQWIKIGRDTLRARDPSPKSDHRAQGSSANKKSPELLVVKISGGRGSGRNCQIFRRLQLKGLNGLRMYANPPTLVTTPTATAKRAPVAQGECLANLQKPGSSTLPSPNPPPTQSHKVVKQVA